VRLESLPARPALAVTECYGDFSTAIPVC
jgi:hypothetical protein